MTMMWMFMFCLSVFCVLVMFFCVLTGMIVCIDAVVTRRTVSESWRHAIKLLLPWMRKQREDNGETI